MSSEKISTLSVDNLKVYYDSPNGDIKAVDGISFDVKGGECLGIVGESGCGALVRGVLVFGLCKVLARWGAFWLYEVGVCLGVC